jgi:hypothetical protein
VTVYSRSLRCVVAASPGGPDDVDRLARCLVALWASVERARAIVVLHGDADPAVVGPLGAAAEELGFELDGVHGNRAAAVNAGLRLALAEGSDALLVDPAVELAPGPWLAALRARDTAAVAGGRLVREADGTIHRAGYYFSRLTRAWQPRLEFAPAELAQAAEPCRCPVDGLTLVRHEALQRVGLYDEELPVPLDAVDFCLRVFVAGGECVYEPAAVAAWIGERPEPLDPKLAGGFDVKWQDTDVSPFAPPVL